MKVPRLTISQKNNIIALLDEYKIEPDRRLYQIIDDLNVQLFGVAFFFDPDFRESVERDKQRIKRIIKIVNEFENEGLKIDFFDTITPSFKYPYSFPRKDEDTQHIVKRCTILAEILQDRGHFKRSKKNELYPFLAALVNILKPGSFSGSDVLSEGEITAFKKYLGK